MNSSDIGTRVALIVIEESLSLVYIFCAMAVTGGMYGKDRLKMQHGNGNLSTEIAIHAISPLKVVNQVVNCHSYPPKVVELRQFGTSMDHRSQSEFEPPSHQLMPSDL